MLPLFEKRSQIVNQWTTEYDEYVKYLAKDMNHSINYWIYGANSVAAFALPSGIYSMPKMIMM